MSRDTMDLSCVPYDEPCAQVGQGGYDERAGKECRAYIAQLKRMHGVPPDGARLKIMHNPHDMGTYLSVAVVYDTNNEAAIDYAYKLEANTPASWDGEAKKQLGLVS